jgi:hypothetical protein
VDLQENSESKPLGPTQKILAARVVAVLDDDSLILGRSPDGFVEVSPIPSGSKNTRFIPCPFLPEGILKFYDFSTA